MRSSVVSVDGVQGNGVQEKAARNQALTSQMASEQDMQVIVTNPLLRATVIVMAMLAAFVLTFWGMHSLRTSDPYVQSVLQLSGNPARGKDIFTLNCATCHGLEAAGEVGPNLNRVSERKSKVALIEQVISGQTPPMPQFQPNEKDMADLLGFLETL